MLYLGIVAAVVLVIWLVYKQGKDSGSASEKSTHQEAALEAQSKENAVASELDTDDDVVKQLRDKAAAKSRLATKGKP